MLHSLLQQILPVHSAFQIAGKHNQEGSECESFTFHNVHNFNLQYTMNNIQHYNLQYYRKV